MNWNKRLMADADRALGAAPHHRKLTLISFGASAGASTVVALLALALDSGIAQTGGLSGIGLRSLLTTVQSLLSLALSLLMPFWAAGYTAAILGIAKGEPVAPGSLLTGFRRFWPLLRLELLQGSLLFLLSFLCIQLSSLVLSFTPLAIPMYLKMMPLMEQGSFDPYNMDPAVAQELMLAGLPVLVGMGVILLAVLIPVSYFLRLTTLRLLDAPEQGARAALVGSIRLMWGNCLKLLRLDLGFWWFYLAQALVLLISWGDVLLPALGIGLPFSGNVALFVFSTLGLAAQLGLYCCFRNRIEVTYARFYLDLLPKDADRSGDQDHSTL